MLDNDKKFCPLLKKKFTQSNHFLEKSIGIFNNWESEVFKQYTEDEKLLLQKTLKQVVINICCYIQDSW